MIDANSPQHVPFCSRVLQYNSQDENGSVGGGPAYFRVWKCTGEILDYGFTEMPKSADRAATQFAVG
jgi:hypothetical protein